MEDQKLFEIRTIISQKYLIIKVKIKKFVGSKPKDPKFSASKPQDHEPLSAGSFISQNSDQQIK